MSADSIQKIADERICVAPPAGSDKSTLIARVRGEVSALSRASKYAPSDEIRDYIDKRLFWAKIRLKKAHNS